MELKVETKPLKVAVAPNLRFAIVPPDAVIERTAAALSANGMKTIVVEDGAAAKAEVLKLVTPGAHVYTTSSRTLEETGIAAELNDSGKYHSVRKVVLKMDRATEMQEIRKLTSAHDFVVGSVHALTETGAALIASGSGSQIPAFAYGGEKVIWVVGAQKIVPDIETGLQRLEEYSLRLESERMQQLAGRNSSLNKILIVKKDMTPGRITIVLIKDNVGF